MNLWCHQNPVQIGFDFYLGDKDRLQQKVFVAEITMKEHEAGTFAKPSFNLEPEAAKMLMDTMWNAGLRPTEWQGSAASTGEVKALQLHLQDSRNLYTKLLDVVLGFVDGK